jgi:peptidoglycan/LPS O-acetylase OafA/YrhL
MFKFVRDGIRSLSQRPSGNRPGLDVLRSLAIILVFSCHFAGEYVHFPHSPLWFKFPLFFFGWTGVDLFFVLSGFLIGGQLWRELNRTGTIQVGSFLIRRGMRIWPLYFATIAFLALVFGRYERGIAQIIPDVLFYSNYAKGIVSGGWSLSTEEQFYIVVPILLLTVVRRLPLRLQGIVPLTLLVALPAVRWFSLHILGWSHDDLYGPFHTHSDGLVMGLVIAWASAAYPVWMKPGRAIQIAVVPVILAVVGVAFRMLDKDVFAFTSLAMIFGGLTVFLLRSQSEALHRVFSWHGFHLVSRLSYGMYLNHFEVLPRLTPPLVRVLSGVIHTNALVCLLAYGVTMVATIGVAIFTFAVIEHPFLVWRDRILGHGKTVAAPTLAGSPKLATAPQIV